jgi:acyl-CoA hydrolase
MEVHRDRAPIIIRLSHSDFRQYLASARELDRKYPWLEQYRYWIDIAAVDDRGVTLKLG